MNFVRYCLRPSLWLVVGCGLLGLPMFGQAQGVTITPPAPEAYQPFTLEWFECSSITDRPYEPVFAVSVEEDTILVSMLPQEPCSDASQVLRKKVANIRGLPGGTYRILMPGPGGFLIVPPPVEVGSVTVSFPPPSIDAVVELRSRTTLHYFLTADEDEQTVLQGGGDGDWYYIDFFYAWSADGPAPTTAKPVCRFYSAAVNSHFYTAGAGECESLKRPGSGWVYEGIAFHALVPTKGVCYPGTRPVWRLYNGRFAQNDTNHRFVTSADTYWHMIANGWIGEGAVFCEPTH